MLDHALPEEPHTLPEEPHAVPEEPHAVPPSPPAALDASQPLPPPPQVAASRQGLRVSLLRTDPPFVYVQMGVVAALAALLLWQRGGRRPGSPGASPRGGARLWQLPLFVRSPTARGSPTGKSPR